MCQTQVSRTKSQKPGKRARRKQARARESQGTEAEAPVPTWEQLKSTRPSEVKDTSVPTATDLALFKKLIRHALNKLTADQTAFCDAYDSKYPPPVLFNQNYFEKRDKAYQERFAEDQAKIEILLDIYKKKKKLAMDDPDQVRIADTNLGSYATREDVKEQTESLALKGRV